jgi:hypothetical protein
MFTKRNINADESISNFQLINQSSINQVHQSSSEPRELAQTAPHKWCTINELSSQVMLVLPTINKCCCQHEMPMFAHKTFLNFCTASHVMP